MNSPEKGRPSARLSSRLLLSFIALSAGLASIELALRFATSTPWYERVVEEQVQPPAKFRYRIGEDWFVLRAAPAFRAKKPGDYRILYFGDSFTYGQGLAQESETFVRLSTAQLNQAAARTPPAWYQAYNGGIPGSRTPQWVRLSSEILASYEPDLVLVVFYLRDGVSGITAIGQIDQIRDGMKRLAKDSFLFRNIAMYRLFRERRSQIELSRKYLSKIHDGYLGDDEQTQIWRQAQAELLDLRRQASDAGARFAIVIFPVLFELTPAYPLRDVCDEVDQFARANDTPALSLLPAFTGLDAQELWVSPFDQHPNARAHAIAADAIVPFIEQLVREEDGGI